MTDEFCQFKGIKKYQWMLSECKFYLKFSWHALTSGNSFEQLNKMQDAPTPGSLHFSLDLVFDKWILTENNE